MHTHLDLYPDALKILQKVNEENIFTLAVTTSPKAWLATSKVFKGYNNIYVSVGLHPEIVESKFNETDLLIDSIKKTNFVGEVGLDGSRNFSKSLPLQEKIFDKVLQECENQNGKIISIHSRGAVSKVLSLIEKYPKCGTPILHWFSGTHKELDYAISLDCWFSVNPKMCKSKKGLSLIEKIPKNRLLPESDGPFVVIDKKALYPWQAISITSDISRLWNCKEDDTVIQFEKNLENLLQGKEMNFE
jgi:TatD DNase family protein